MRQVYDERFQMRQRILSAVLVMPVGSIAATWWSASNRSALRVGLVSYAVLSQGFAVTHERERRAEAQIRLRYPDRHIGTSDFLALRCNPRKSMVAWNAAHQLLSAERRSMRGIRSVRQRRRHWRDSPGPLAARSLRCRARTAPRRRRTSGNAAHVPAPRRRGHGATRRW